mmetsp:Transcript_19978/g.30020  ORF Transcript_19978/g.30020 Transcript_19978/m.30020 type:complete len:168 (-) Transcript_19978:351-854(-)
MRGCCLDGDGATYSLFSEPNIRSKIVAWIPQTNLEEHANNPNIVETLHLDHLDSEDGRTLLTRENLLKAVKTPNTQKDTLGFNSFQDLSTITEAIELCQGNLKCVSFSESVFSVESDSGLAQVQRASPGHSHLRSSGLRCQRRRIRGTFAGMYESEMVDGRYWWRIF